MTDRTRQSGFSLIEVMVVVAIMGILAVIAVPNLTGVFRRSALGAEGRRLYSAIVEAQGLAASESVSHCLLFNRTAQSWTLRNNANDDGNCDVADRLVMAHGGSAGGGDDWPSHVAYGPIGGISNPLPIPYANVDVDAWCTPCGAGTTGAVFFDVDGRIVDSGGVVIPHGAIMLYDETGESDGLVEVVMFIGPTGNVRLFSVTE